MRPPTSPISAVVAAAPRPRFHALRSPVIALALAVSLGAGLGVSLPAGAQSTPRFQVVLETSVVSLLGADAARADIEIHRAGTVAATGFALTGAGRPGEIVYFLFWRSEPGRMLAGDTIRTVGMVPAVEVTVPDLRVDIDEAGGRIAGVGPAGAELRVQAEYRTATGGAGSPRTFDERVRAGPDGRFAVDLTDAGLVPGDHGEVTWGDPAGHVFSAPFAVFLGQITLGQGRMTLDSALGLAARIEQVPSGGAALPVIALRTGGAIDEARRGVTDVALGTAARAGDLITLIRERPVLGRSSVHAVRVPALTVEIVPQTDRVIGQVPPGAAATVTVRAPDGTEYTRNVTGAPDGRLAADFAGEADIDRGWRAEVAVDAGAGWQVRADVLVGLLNVEVDLGLVSGDVGPDTAVTVVAFDVRGGELHRWETTASSSGRFSVDLILRGGRIEAEVLALEPGMVIGVDLARSGDPTLLEIPELSAQADIDREAITGAAPPGYRVLAEVWNGTSVAARSAEVAVDGDGRFEVPLAGVYDVEPATEGRLVVLRPDGHRFSLTWVALRSRLELDTGMLWVEAPTHRVGMARLLDAQGTQRAAASLLTRRETSSRRRLSALDPLVDRFGRPVIPAPGDRVEGWIGGDRFSFRVPRLDAAAHLADDRVAGSTDAPEGTPLGLTASDSGGGQTSRNMQVPAGGGFSFDLSQPQGDEGVLDLAYNGRITLQLDQRAARFSRRIAVPGLVLDLSGGRLTGTLAPNAAGAASWRRAGQALASLAVRADAAGAFLADLRHPDGRRFELHAGDEIAVESGDLAEGPVAITVPSLELAFDRAINGLGGRIARVPGDCFRLTTERLQSLPDVENSGRWDEKLVWLGDGRFSIDFDEHPVRNPVTGQEQIFTAVTGAVARATLDLPDGHRVLLSRLLPMLHIQHGGDTVCGQADPDSLIDLRLTDPAGGALASARTLAAPDGKFVARLDASAGVPALREGLRLEGELGSEPLALTLPPMDVAFDWASYALRLRGLPGHPYRLRYPALWDCWGGSTDALRALPGVYVMTAHRTTDSGGELVYDASSMYALGASPAQGLEVETTDPSLHRLFTFVYTLQAEVHLGTDRVSGQGSPYRELAGRLERADGTRPASGASVTDGAGRFTLRLAAEGGVGAKIAAGDVLVLATAGESARLEVPALDYDFSAASGLAGTAAPNTDITLTLRLADGRELATSARSDAQGRFTFRPEDVPRGESWTLADVRSLRAEHRFQRYHRVVRDMADAEDPGPPPVRSGVALLPWVGREP